MSADLRIRAQVFLDLADQLDHERGSPAEAKRLRRLAQELIGQAEEAERGEESGAPPAEEKPPTPGLDLPAPTPDKPEK